MVADALSREPASLNATIKIRQPELWKELDKLNTKVVSYGMMAALEVKPTLVDQINKPKRVRKVLRVSRTA